MKELTPFTFINSICFDKRDYTDDELNIYNQFLTNKMLSHYNDTIFIANEINCLKTYISNKKHFETLKNLVSKRKRFAKIVKKSNISKDVEMLMGYFNYSKKKAEEAYKILSSEDIKEIKKKLKDN